MAGFLGKKFNAPVGTSIVTLETAQMAAGIDR
jgi:hypothetical protein